jgi:hypothetical protein
MKETARLAWKDSFASGTGFKYPQKLMVVVLVMGLDYYFYCYYYLPKHELRLSFSRLTVSFVGFYILLIIVNKTS